MLIGGSVVSWNDLLDIVDRNFKYLETEFAFRKVSTQCPFVEYESSFIRIGIYYDIGVRNELDVRIWPLQKIGKRESSFGIGSLVDLHNPDDPENRESPFPNTKKQLEMEVQTYARLLRKYGSDVLRGDLRDLLVLHKAGEEIGTILGTPKPGKSYVEIVKEVTRKYSEEHLKEHSKEHQHRDDSKS
jgi:hypothetical protein